MAGQLRRRRAARRRPARAAARGARRTAAAGRVRDAAVRHPDLLRPRKAGAAPPLTHRRLSRPRRRCAARLHRRRVPQFPRRRHHLHGGAHLGPAWHQHGDRRGRARDSAGGRRRRGPARRRLQPGKSAAPERDHRHLRDRRRAARVRHRRNRARCPALRAGDLVGKPPLHRDVRSHPRSAPRRDRRERAAPGRADRRRYLHRRRVRTDDRLMAIDKVNLATVEKMWRREVEAAATYKHLANREKDPKRRDILLRLAEQEDRHADRWSERIAQATGRVPDPEEVKRGLSWFQRISDPNVVLHRLEQEENKAEAEYDALMARLTDPDDRRIAEEAAIDERDHAVVLRTLAGGKIPTPRSTLDSILGRERWHVRGTGWIGDAIYGINDGLGAVFGIVSGMAGYTGGSEVVLAAGAARHARHALSLGGGGPPPAQTPPGSSQDEK